MRPRRSGLGPLGRRLLLAFSLVAGVSVLVMAVAGLFAVGHGLAVVEEDERDQVATRVAAAAAEAYRVAAGWDGADLGRADAIAEAADARLVLLDASGQTMRMGQGGHGQGSAGGPMGGEGVVTADVVLDGEVVGAVRLVFGSASTAARDVAWTWIVVAAAVALVVAVMASWVVTRTLTRPIRAITAAARSFAAGDRAARAGTGGTGEIGELSRTFDALADTVMRTEADRRNVTADVAHELRTPLAALQAGLEELRDGLVAPTAEGFAALHDQSLRLGRVVQDLAELSAAEAAGAPATMVEVDLAEVVRDEVAARRPQLRAAELVVVERVTGPTPVRGDADRLHQAVGNILANAARYCRPGDRVDVVVTGDGAQVAVEIADTGPGIPADELPHVFDRLWRGRAAREVAGTGIGLAVARQIVVAHGGTITAESAGAGTTIVIRLPVIGRTGRAGSSGRGGQPGRSEG